MARSRENFTFTPMRITGVVADSPITWCDSRVHPIDTVLIFRQSSLTPYMTYLSTSSLDGARIPVEIKYCSLLQNVQTASGAHLASYSMRTGVLSRRQSGRGVKLTTNFHLVARLRRCGATPLVLPHFPSWRGQGKFYPLASLLRVHNKEHVTYIWIFSRLRCTFTRVLLLRNRLLMKSILMETVLTYVHAHCDSVREHGAMVYRQRLMSLVVWRGEFDCVNLQNYD